MANINNISYFYTLLDTITYDNGDTVGVLLTDFMVRVVLDKNGVEALINRKVPIKNMKMNYDFGTNTLVSYRPIVKIECNQQIVLYKTKKQSGDTKNKTFIASDLQGNLYEHSYEQIISNLEMFPNIKKHGNTLRQIYGTIATAPNIINKIVEIQRFNRKASLLGIAQLEYSIKFEGVENNKLRLVVTGIKNRTVNNGSLIIPDIVDEISASAFKNTGIKKLTIGSGIKEIKTNTFALCTNLMQVRLGENIETIGIQAFCHCYNLEKVEFNSKLKTIKESAFQRTDLRELYIEGELSIIEASAFRWCSKLQKIDLYNTKIKSLTTDAFIQQSGRLTLTKLMLPKTLEYINLSNFPNLKYVQELYIPTSLTSVRDGSSEAEVRLNQYLNALIVLKELKTITQDKLKEDIIKIYKTRSAT